MEKIKKAKISITLDYINMQLLDELELGLGLNRSEVIRMVLTMYGNHLKQLSSLELFDLVGMKEEFIKNVNK